MLIAVEHMRETVAKGISGGNISAAGAKQRRNVSLAVISRQADWRCPAGSLGHNRLDASKGVVNGTPDRQANTSTEPSRSEAATSSACPTSTARRESKVRGGGPRHCLMLGVPAGGVAEHISRSLSSCLVGSKRPGSKAQRHHDAAQPFLKTL